MDLVVNDVYYNIVSDEDGPDDDDCDNVIPVQILNDDD